MSCPDPTPRPEDGQTYIEYMERVGGRPVNPSEEIDAKLVEGILKSDAFRRGVADVIAEAQNKPYDGKSGVLGDITDEQIDRFTGAFQADPKLEGLEAAIAAVRQPLQEGARAAYAADFDEAYRQFVAVIWAASELKDKFAPRATPPEVRQCEASSWQSKVHRPFGPQGLNRCVRYAEPAHEQHKDAFGNVFRFNPNAAGGVHDPRVKILRHEAPGEVVTG